MLLVRQLIALSWVVLRIRVSNTRLPFLWLGIPSITRLAPVLAITFTLSDDQGGLFIITFYLILTAMAIYLRRGTKIIKIYQARIPDLFKSNVSPRLFHTAFIFLTFLENFPVMIIIFIGLVFQAGIEYASVFFFQLLGLFWISLVLSYLYLPLIIYIGNKIEDFRQGFRYIIMSILIILILIQDNFEVVKPLAVIFPYGFLVYLKNLTEFNFANLAFASLNLTFTFLLGIYLFKKYSKNLEQANEDEDQ